MDRQFTIRPQVFAISSDSIQKRFKYEKTKKDTIESIRQQCPRLQATYWNDGDITITTDESLGKIKQTIKDLKLTARPLKEAVHTKRIDNGQEQKPTKLNKSDIE